jgi:hypothetical protein
MEVSREKAKTPIPILQRKDGTLPADNRVREALRKAIKSSGKTRDEIAHKMSELLGRTVTASMLADFSRNGTRKRQVRFPAGWVGAFCQSVGNNELALATMGAELRGIVELREEQVKWLAESLRAELLKPNARHKTKGKRPRES